MVKKDWQKKERTDAHDFDARQTPRSGGLWFAKGDSRSKRFLIESKTTIHKGFAVTEKLWKKVEKEGLLSRRIPLLSIKFKDGIELIVLDKNDFISLVEKK